MYIQIENKDKKGSLISEMEQQFFFLLYLLWS